MSKVNAVIMAAGLSSRFAPLSYELPKALLTVRGEVLIERQIRQLREAGVDEVIIVTGYMKDAFSYLRDKYNVILIDNPLYAQRNNHESLWIAKEYIKDTFICSADNYFSRNVFKEKHEQAYYAAVYEAGETSEWCLQTSEDGLIREVQIGGRDAWIMMGHVFFTKEFSDKFFNILADEYDKEETKDKLWEAIYREHVDELHMYIKKYENADIFEFDSLDELREFDQMYKTCSNSSVLKKITDELACYEHELHDFKPIVIDKVVCGCSFLYQLKKYVFYYHDNSLVCES